MDFEIVDKDSFMIVGLVTNTDHGSPSFKKDLEKLWMDFIPRVNEVANIVPGVLYGTYEMTGETSMKCVAGIEVTKEEDIPEGMVLQKVPANKYLKTTHKGHNDKLMETYKALEEETKIRGLEGDHSKIAFEYYDDRYNHDSEDSECDVYVPIK